MVLTKRNLEIWSKRPKGLRQGMEPQLRRNGISYDWLISPLHQDLHMGHHLCCDDRNHETHLQMVQEHLQTKTRDQRKTSTRGRETNNIPTKIPGSNHALEISNEISIPRKTHGLQQLQLKWTQLQWINWYGNKLHLLPSIFSDNPARNHMYFPYK